MGRIVLNNFKCKHSRRHQVYGDGTWKCDDCETYFKFDGPRMVELERSDIVEEWLDDGKTLAEHVQPLLDACNRAIDLIDQAEEEDKFKMRPDY